jgi:hypothetical protein
MTHPALKIQLNDELEVDFDNFDELASICVSAKFVKRMKESRE